MVRRTVRLQRKQPVAASIFDQTRGLLRVDMPVIRGVRHIAPLLPEYARRYPAVTVELGVKTGRPILVEEGWDMAVRSARLANSELLSRPNH